MSNRKSVPQLLKPLGLYWRYIFLSLGLIWILFTGLPITQAQSSQEPASYWQYPASGQLHQVVITDIDLDGVEEFLLLDENNRIDLISGSGTLKWSYFAPDSVLTLSALNLNGVDRPQPEIIIGLPGQIILLSSTGDELWRSSLIPPDNPLPLRDDGGQFNLEDTLDNFSPLPEQILPYDLQNDGQIDILVLMKSGHLLLFDLAGNLVWRENQFGTIPEDVPPKMLVADFDGDDQDEIVLGVFNPRGFGKIIYLDNEDVLWDVSLSGRITDLKAVKFRENDNPQIAVGTTLGQLHLYDHQRQQQWFRTLNRPITSLAVIPHGDNISLAVGTSVGTVTNFNYEGRRLWESKLSDNADRPVIALSSNPTIPTGNQPVLAIILGPSNDNAEFANVILLGSDGQAFGKISNVDQQGLTQFVDSNHDQNSELLVSRLATLELLGLGIGDSENVNEWEYSLGAAPSAVLVGDFDGDSEDELIIGTQDGRIHSLSNDRAIRWLHDTGGVITSLSAFAHSNIDKTSILVTREEDQGGNLVATIEMRDAKGERSWEKTLESPGSVVLVDNIDSRGDPEIIVGTRDGRIMVFNASGRILWNITIPDFNSEITELRLFESIDSSIDQIIAASSHRILAIDLTEPNEPAREIADYDGEIIDIYPFIQSGNEELNVRMLVLVNDGFIHGLNWRGEEMAQWSWPQAINGIPSTSIAIFDNSSTLIQEVPPAILIGTANGQFLRIDIENNEAVIPWRLDNLGEITTLHWLDESNDGRSGLALVGNSDGVVRYYSQIQTTNPNLVIDPIESSGSIFALNSLESGVGRSPDLLVVTESGLVQLFREQENRPPLLTEPEIEIDPYQYRISVNVTDVEGDNVTVSLEIQNESGDWTPLESQNLSNGRGTLFWLVPPPPQNLENLPYRFIYDDGSYQGILTPPPGPPAIITNSPWTDSAPIVLLGAITLALIAGVIYLTQSQTPNARARRFYRRLRQEPTKSLDLLSTKYSHSEGSPDILLNLAGLARQADDRFIADLSDGLFLLEDQPISGLSILVETVDDIAEKTEPIWSSCERWQMTYQTCLAMLEAPSVTELSLLRPQLLHLIDLMEEQKQYLPVIGLLKPILTDLRDSERVDLVEDRLVYLNKASSRIQQGKVDIHDFDPSIERTLVSAILRRWLGLVIAEIEELRGRAVLFVSLITKRIVPSEETIVALTVGNHGRSAAENIIVELDQNPAYINLSPPQEIPFLPSGQTREVRFSINPQVIDRFRLSVALTYDDRNQQDKKAAFGDMVYILPPSREFSPLANPYVPGTPLRPNSLLFFGREDLFDFVAESAGAQAFRNVLILVGQRRSGKTSALLRLNDHLPSHLIPVYIDCQSLGVVPGMPALLEELAWYIADALSQKDILVDIPDIEQWQQDPSRIFQREFLPNVISLLPENSTLLLVFDEFEAFEDLVSDGILPQTFFSYLRHLMQHGKQLNFIFVGTRRLEEMTSNYWSVLFNIALYRKIGFLSQEAATRLITEPVAPHLIYDDLAIDKILRVTAGHPYFLQLVCYTLVKRANVQKTPYITVSDVNAAVDEMLSLGEVHFAYIWQRSTPSERALLTAAAHLMDSGTPYHPEELLNYLEKYGIDLDPAEITDALDHLIYRDIMREVSEGTKTLYELKLGLVGLWVAQNKSLSKLYAGNGSGEIGQRGNQPLTTKVGI